jgi:spermidine/putrescine-binding protein
LPIAPLPMNAETLLIPNTVAITRGAPHADAAQKLLDYLQRPAIVERLFQAKALEGASTTEVKASTLNVGWDTLLRDLEQTTSELNRIFLR